MYILSLNIWFQTLIRQFFFNIDNIVFGFISTIYDLLISIARTSVLSQADIQDMASRIYKLLAIFMVFKVTFSLIMYVVNPDDFSDKSKGVSKLGTNIIISLLFLILTPYAFNLAFQLQTIVLEDNSLATLIFGNKLSEDNFISTAGDDMAFLVMQPFFLPNSALEPFAACVTVDDECFDAMESKASSSQGNDNKFSTVWVENYKYGIKNSNLGLTFRQDLALSTIKVDDDETFVMDYKYVFSTVVGVVVVLLLITFCMDVAVRSIKLSFLQLIAPIPIISYVDPKSGKDGMFKKWYQMCFKTFLSLFIRLLALYFAVYIISRVAGSQLVDIVDGSYQTNAFIKIFIIIGALMFAKQFPKILEGLGLKLDGGFTLNPLKKMEKEMVGGKAVSKLGKGAAVAAGGAALVGGASLLTGKGLGGTGRAMMTAIKGGFKGNKFGKNFSSSYSAGAARKKQLEQMKLDGVSQFDVAKENLKNKISSGATAKDQYSTFKSDLDAVTNGYKSYYNTALAADKLAKEFERRRVAAENAGNDKEAKLWQDSIDNRIKTITKSGNNVALNDKNNVAFDTAEDMLAKFRSSNDYSQSTYGAAGNTFESTAASKFDATDIVNNTGLSNIQRNINIGIDELNSKFVGKYDYDGGLSKTDNLKVTNGKAKGYATAAESSEEKNQIDSLYKYVENKSNK